jgi:LacI family transcriptional regulator
VPSTDEVTPSRPSLSTGQDRVDGYLAALTGAGTPDPRAYLRTGAHSPEQAQALTDHLIALPEPPTAVFASDSRVALGVLKAIRTAGLAVPDRMSVVSFDDADWTSVVTPPISVVAQPTQAMGRRAAEMLIERIEGADRPAELHMMATEFLSRESVAPPASGAGHEVTAGSGRRGAVVPRSFHLR